METKFPRLRKPAALADRIDGWRVCGLGGGDKGRVFYVVMVERTKAPHATFRLMSPMLRGNVHTATDKAH
jgi:hypothetical protein